MTSFRLATRTAHVNFYTACFKHTVWKCCASGRHRFFSSDIGIIGLPNIGKSALFNALTKTQIAQSLNFPFCTIEPNKAKVSVADLRLRELAKIAKSTKVIESQVNFVDIAGLVQGAHEGKGLGNQFLNNIRSVDALVHVVRCFEEPDILHVEESIDPVRDLQIIRNELIFADLQLVDKRLQPNAIKKLQSNPDAHTIQAVLERCAFLLDSGLCVTQKNFKGAQDFAPLVDFARQWQCVLDLTLLSSKPVVHVCNCDDESAALGNEMTDAVQDFLREHDSEEVAAQCLPLCIIVEEEVSREDEKSQLELLKLIGVKRTGVERVIDGASKLLDMHCFYTVGDKEARSWLLKRNSTAVEAAAKIHSDFASGFVRAEVTSYDDFVARGGIQNARKAGESRQEGKSYVVKSGDIITFHSSS